MDYIEFTSKLANILNEQNLSKIEFKGKDIEVHIESAKVAAVTAASAVSQAVNSEPVNQPEVEKTGNFVTSPIVGTFYSAPAPDKPPFVKVGDTVKKGQVVCIIESMKLMNEINCEFDGKVAAVLAMDGDVVDYGKELIRIE